MLANIYDVYNVEKRQIKSNGVKAKIDKIYHRNPGDKSFTGSSKMRFLRGILVVNGKIWLVVSFHCGTATLT